jgi:hypothetical protein
MTASERQDLVASERLQQIGELREGLGQIAVRVMATPTMLRCCHLIDAELASLAGLSPKGTSGSEWVRITERLPALGQSVALIHEDRYENTGGDLEMNVRACGYLHEMRPGDPYWSIRGERATCLDAFTHWLALPSISDPS